MELGLAAAVPGRRGRATGDRGQHRAGDRAFAGALPTATTGWWTAACRHLPWAHSCRRGPDLIDARADWPLRRSPHRRTARAPTTARAVLRNPGARERSPCG